MSEPTPTAEEIAAQLREAKQENEVLRVKMEGLKTASDALSEARSAREEAANLRQQIEASKAPTDEELIANGNASQNYFEKHRQEIREAWERRNVAAEHARRDALREAYKPGPR